MHWNQVEGQWDALKSKFKEKWSKLTDDDLHDIRGDKDKLADRVGKSYGIDRAEADKQIDEFSQGLDKDRTQ